jgi:3-oxoacyl-[acyl-carrier-protein] synthase II
LGCVTPLGSQTQAVWEALTGGQSGVAEITNFDASSFPVRIAAEVKGWSLGDYGEGLLAWERHARQTQFAIGAALKAFESSGVSSAAMDPSRCGVYLGCGEVFPELTRLTMAIGTACAGGQMEAGRFQQHYTAVTPPQIDSTMEPGAAVSAIAGLLGLEGPSVNFTNACVSSAAALGEAKEAICRGDADVMVAGGAHSMINATGITAFSRLKTLSLRNDDPQAASRPFDRDRDGFVAGEGAAIIVLEELQHAKNRGAEIWAELRGYGSAHDAYRVTDLRPDGQSAARSMRLALRDAKLSAADIAYVNAHGSSTVVNDSVETTAIKKAFGESARDLAISSTKSMTGHLTTACGALEVLFCILTAKHGVAPPTINYANPDPDCDLDYVPNIARELNCEHVMNNNFGFGGQNVALVVSRFDG